MKAHPYPAAVHPELVGTYPALANAGGGYVWDEVLEYRVWSRAERGAEGEDEGKWHYRAFATYADAAEFAKRTEGADAPIALVLQEEYLDEPEEGRYVHVRERRVTEWSVALLRRPRRTPTTIPDFLSPDAPANRLAILRGTGTGKKRRAPPP
ncbi:MAG: GCN5 family acetyltransferase [Deltaproteobacteria bacterium]|nr:GCN5 family acetyltransferase [Deltaproteobacteria bacterium]